MSVAKYHPARIHRIEPLADDGSVAERLLWNQLRTLRDDGLQFRRRVAIEGHTVDMVCVRAQVVVQLSDGLIVSTGYESALQRLLEGLGYRVLRVSRADVLDDSVAVAQQVLDTCSERLARVAFQMH